MTQDIDAMFDRYLDKEIAEYYKVPLSELVKGPNDLDINNLSQEIKSIKDDIEIIKNILSHR